MYIIKENSIENENKPSVNCLFSLIIIDHYIYLPAARLYERLKFNVFISQTIWKWKNINKAKTINLPEV